MNVTTTGQLRKALAGVIQSKVYNKNSYAVLTRSAMQYMHITSILRVISLAVILRHLVYGLRFA